MADVNDGHEEHNTDQEGLYDANEDGEDEQEEEQEKVQEEEQEDEEEEPVESRRQEKAKGKAPGSGKTARGAEKHKAKGKGKASGLANPRRRVSVPTPYSSMLIQLHSHQRRHAEPKGRVLLRLDSAGWIPGNGKHAHSTTRRNTPTVP